MGRTVGYNFTMQMTFSAVEPVQKGGRVPFKLPE